MKKIKVKVKNPLGGWFYDNTKWNTYNRTIQFNFPHITRIVIEIKPKNAKLSV